MSRVALVTGGSRGIGLACARALADAGHKVAVTVNSTPCDEFFSVAGDLSEPAAAAAAVDAVEEQFGPIEILVSNAGITRDGLLVRMSDDDFDAVVNTNLGAAFRLARRSAKSMMKNRWGRLIFMSSVGAYIGSPGQANYAASKAGLIGLARSMARELGSRGITSNVVAPGPILTDMLAALPEDRRDLMAKQVPLGRIGEPEEVAALVRFLASEESSFITGAVIPVDGGLGMGG